jgi:hypothetical protein
VGAFETFLSGEVEATVEYHPAGVLNLTLDCYEYTNLMISEPAKD